MEPQKNTEKEQRIFLAISSCNNKERTRTPEQVYFWRHQDLFNVAFYVRGAEKRHIELCSFFLPRELCELLPGKREETAYTELKLSDQLSNYDLMRQHDTEKYVDRWPNSLKDDCDFLKMSEQEVITHRKILMRGFLSLTAVQAAKYDSIKEIAKDLKEWEEHLYHELLDFPAFSTKIRIFNIPTLNALSEDSRERRVFYKIASAYAELLSHACPVIRPILKLDGGNAFLLLFLGYQEAKKHTKI